MKKECFMNGTNINASNFQAEVIDSPVPVLLDFWAVWCNPCKMISPFLDQIAQEHAGKLKVGRINVDEENELASKHGVVSIPTLVLYKNGEEVNRQVGAVPKKAIEAIFAGQL
jgi:thioredoxin 1